MKGECEIMEMAVEVKRSLPPREEKILVAIDVAIRNIEKLSVITALCHQLLLENQDFTSFSTPSQSLETLLGREIHEILKTIVSFLKPANKSNANKELAIACSHKSDFAQTNRNTVSKQDLIYKLKQNREKREFLQKIIENAKIFLENKKLLISTSTASSLIPSNASNNSVVGLLREALSSKYQDDVRQAIRDLDVESLTSIFYLMEFADDKPEAPSKFSITFDEEMESFYNLRSPSSTESDKSDYLMYWGTEPDDKGEDKDDPNLGFERSIITYHEYEDFADPADKGQLLKDNLLTIMLHSSPSLVADKVTGLHFKLLACEFPLQFYSIVNDGNKELQELLKCMKDFRSFASQFMATNRPRPTKLSIEHQLLVIQQRKLQAKLTKLKEKEEEQQGRLDAQLFEWSKKCDKAQEEILKNIKCSIKEHLIEEAKKEKGFQRDFGRISENLKTVTGSLSDAVGFVKQCTKRLRARRHFLEASLEGLIREYDSTMLKYQREFDDLGIVEMNNAREIDALQVKFKTVEEEYDEMKAMRRLKEILQNMEKAEALKQHWAARKIQMAWRKYKVAKLRKKKLKGRKKGKKKTPPPQQGKASSPSKSSGTTSRSKSQTP